VKNIVAARNPHPVIGARMERNEVSTFTNSIGGGELAAGGWGFGMGILSIVQSL
jgi:hypothetical protein